MECQADPNKCVEPFLLWQHGFFRKLNDGKFEWMSFCNPLSNQYGITFNTVKFYQVLDANLPEKKVNK